MSKNLNLTEKQKTKVPFYIEKWSKIGLEYATIDLEEAKKRLLPYLALAGIKPKYFLKFSSPLMCELAINTLKGLDPQLDSQFDSQVFTQLNKQLRERFKSDLEEKFPLELEMDSMSPGRLFFRTHSRLSSQLYLHFHFQIDNQISVNLTSGIDEQLKSKVDSQLREQLRLQPCSKFTLELISKITSTPQPQLKGINPEYFPLTYWTQSGNIVAGSCAFYDFLFNEVKKISRLWKVFIDVQEYLHYFFVFKDWVFISEKPTQFHFKGTQLHNGKGVAVEYADGWELYFLNGVIVPASLVETTAEKISVELALNEKDANVQREIIRKIGVERLLEYTKLLHSFKDSHIGGGNTYELRQLIVGEHINRKYLYFEHASMPGLFFMKPVPPECTRAVEARAWILSIIEREDLGRINEELLLGKFPEVVS